MVFDTADEKWGLFTDKNGVWFLFSVFFCLLLGVPVIFSLEGEKLLRLKVSLIVITLLITLFNMVISFSFIYLYFLLFIIVTILCTIIILYPKRTASNKTKVISSTAAIQALQTVAYFALHFFFSLDFAKLFQWRQFLIWVNLAQKMDFLF